jgi:hypothetical protein
MYKQIKDLHNKLGSPFFAMVVSHLLQVGINTIKNITDKDIAKLKGNKFFTKEFEQKICVNAKELANIITDNPMALIQYCVAEDLVDINIFVPFEEKEIAKIVWKNQDIIEAYKQKVGEKPTEDVVYEVLDYLNIDSDGGLEDCSQGWEVINVAIDEYLEAKK